MSAAVVTAARRWIGTPYRHQGACRGGGCDCLGLIRGVWAEVSGQPVEPVPPYTRDWAEPQGQEVLWAEAERRLVCLPLNQEGPGQVLLFRMRDRGVAKHLGLQAEVGAGATFVHAFSGHGVVESPLTQPWRRRIVARFAFPERMT